MIYTGIDIANNEHVIGATDERSKNEARPMPSDNSNAGFDRCAAYLDGLAGSKTDLLVSMETTALLATAVLPPAGRGLRRRGRKPHPHRCDAPVKEQLARKDRYGRLRIRGRDAALRRLRSEQAGRRGNDWAAAAHAPAPRAQRERRRPEAPGRRRTRPDLPRARLHLFEHLRRELQGVPKTVPDA